MLALINMESEVNNNDKISKIEHDVAQIKIQLSEITKMLAVLTKSSQKLNNHIDFVEVTYDTLKTPLNYIKDTVNKISFRPSLISSLSNNLVKNG